jgi:hypothetical protein
MEGIEKRKRKNRLGHDVRSLLQALLLNDSYFTDKPYPKKSELKQQVLPTWESRPHDSSDQILSPNELEGFGTE